MQSDKKRQQFAISIRRKQVTQRIQALRSQIMTNENDTSINYQKFMTVINQIKTGQKQVQTCLKQLKILSYNKQAASQVQKMGIHHNLYSYLAQHNNQIAAQQYNDIITILINLCVHIELDIPNQILQMITINITKPDRQVITLWLIANFIYQKSAFSGLLAKELVEKCEGIQYMQGRVTKKFHHQGDIVIFNFFCSAFLTVSGNLQPVHVKKILNVVESILKFEPKREQNLWFLSQALVDHGPFIGVSEYEIFGTEFMKIFLQFCKSKKTKYVKNYLKMLIGFTKYDKLAYQKLLKFEIFTHLNFCLQNRFPEVKKLCAEIGINLLQNFGEKVDIQNIGFFQQMVFQLLNLQKYTVDIQQQLVRYGTRFFSLSLSNRVTRQSKQKFITQLLKTNLIQVLIACIANNNVNIELLLGILQLLQLFIKADENKYKRVITRCKSEKIVEYLENFVNRIAMEGTTEVSTRVESFLQHFY